MERSEIAKTMMVITVDVLILSVSLVVVVDGEGVKNLSPNYNSQVLSSPAFNSSEDVDNFKTIHYTSKPIASIGSRILHKGTEILGLPKVSRPFHTPIPPDVFIKTRSEMANEADLVGVTYGGSSIKGKTSPFNLTMKDYVFAETRKIGKRVVGIFAIFDGYHSPDVPAFLHSHLLKNIITWPTFVLNPVRATKEAYLRTNAILMKPDTLLDASTAVTATLVRHNESGQSIYKLVVANVGDSRAIICCNNGEARQLSVDHTLNNKMEKKAIKKRGGLIWRSGATNELHVFGIFPLTRAFGCWNLRKIISCEPDEVVEVINDQIEFLVLASTMELYVQPTSCGFHQTYQPYPYTCLLKIKRTQLMILEKIEAQQWRQPDSLHVED